MIHAGIAQADDANAEEDAIVAGQAIAAGCRWIASNNLTILGGAALDRWLNEQRATDKPLASASVPLVLHPDEAIDTILGRHYDHREDRRLLTAIAWELTRPNDPQLVAPAQRVDILERFANALEAGGAPQGARSIRITLDETAREPTATAKLLERIDMTGRLDRSRAAEQRQVNAEREALGFTQQPIIAQAETGPRRSDTGYSR